MAAAAAAVAAAHDDANLEIDAIMAKLEADNKFLEELDRQRAKATTDSNGSGGGHVGVNAAAANSSGGSGGAKIRKHNHISDSGFLSTSSLAGSTNNSPTATKQATDASHTSKRDEGVVDDEDDQEDQNPGEPTTIDVPGKGRAYVLVARYDYDPFMASPNECPESELAVAAGDHVLAWAATPDDDGFYDGERLDGRRGLVPSNYVEMLTGERLETFRREILLGLGGCDDSVCTSVPKVLFFSALNLQ